MDLYILMMSHMTLEEDIFVNSFVSGAFSNLDDALEHAANTMSWKTDSTPANIRDIKNWEFEDFGDDEKNNDDDFCLYYITDTGGCPPFKCRFQIQRITGI